MRRLGVAVIGVGFWGRNHARVLSSLDRAELVAVCDLDRRRAEEVARSYGVEAYTDSSELLSRDDVEAVTICTWPTSLASETRRALEAGKHALVEKPMARGVEEARELVQLAEREDLILAVGFVERFNPGLGKVRELVEKGELGKVLCASSRRLSLWPKRPWDVGVVRDLAIHDLDLLSYLMGSPPAKVYARVMSLNSNLDDYALIMLSFPEGELGLIEASWLTAPKVRELRITGTEGVLELDYLSQEVKVMRERGRPPEALSGRWEEPLKIELGHFVDCVLSHKEPMASGLDGLRALGLCEAVLRSSSTGKPVDIESTP